VRQDQQRAGARFTSYSAQRSLDSTGHTFQAAVMARGALMKVTPRSSADLLAHFRMLDQGCLLADVATPAQTEQHRHDGCSGLGCHRRIRCPVFGAGAYAPPSSSGYILSASKLPSDAISSQCQHCNSSFSDTDKTCLLQPFDWIKAQLPGGAVSEASEGESTA